ncbi:MAG: extra-cytoplasmic solute receptor family protein [Ramlibacter sp.]|uniref:Bug family tripartite tricarboxylate transporter substrate binding protein n=1 Tax=Ramlibacter sp. TaxID=1917967 RepID=UPI002606807F|nr:tripartite tricarboxylate transporter substrate binding protein [Ramlibacter sp.]MDB5751759.1 extra-cytoplasmic solute receptor family protein [Ramlibacter sp.]
MLPSLVPKLAGIVMMAVTSWTHAQSAATYPDRPVTIVVPFAAGGASDILARQLGKQLSQVLGQSFIADNRVGAGGTVGARAVQRSAPNGYTLLMGTNASHAIAAATNKNLGYDPVRNFTPISLVAHVPQILMVHPSLPVNNVKELIAFAKANSGKLNFSSAGNGTPGHLGMELFKIMAGIEMTHVPYQGGGPGLLALAGGQVQLMADNVSAALPQIKAGKVRAIAVTTGRRSSVLPDLPTIAEQALPGFDSGSWFALFAPADTPKDIVAKLNAETIKALNAPEVRETLLAQGAEPSPGKPEELTKLIRDDIEKWTRVAEKIGFRAE